jgi:hypothetical protein
MDTRARKKEIHRERERERIQVQHRLEHPLVLIGHWPFCCISALKVEK